MNTLRLPTSLLRALCCSFLLCLSSATAAQEPAAGEPYRLGIGDVVQISVWQQPDLDRELRIRDDGSIVVPLVGEAMAVGMTVPELEEFLARRFRSFNRDITEVSVTVTSYQSLQVFVMGAVVRPGVQSFETLPNAWDAVRAAGGPSASANLRRVRILRQTAAGTATQVINLSGVLSGGETGLDIPRLQPGDTVIVPDSQLLTAADRESGVHVLGAVARPGLYPVEASSPLMTVVLQAGGFSDGADLTLVRVVHPTSLGPVEALEVNVRLYLENGQLQGNPLIEPGDTIFVERRTTTRDFFRSAPQLMTATVALVTLVLNLVR